MGKIEAVLKAEIVRLARRETKTLTAKHVGELRRLRQRIALLEREVRAVKAARAEDQLKTKIKTATETVAGEQAVRLSPRLIRSLRGRLGISQAELAKLDIQVSDSTIRKYRPKPRRSPSAQTWKTFLQNHVQALVAVDFFAVPTATFRVLYVFLVLAHDRRKILHFNVTDAPSARWTAQQMFEAFPYTIPPHYLLRDRDAIYGEDFARRRSSRKHDKAKQFLGFGLGLELEFERRDLKGKRSHIQTNVRSANGTELMGTDVVLLGLG